LVAGIAVVLAVDIAVVLALGIAAVPALDRSVVLPVLLPPVPFSPLVPPVSVVLLPPLSVLPSLALLRGFRSRYRKAHLAVIPCHISHTS
jgi:hypothetical protein